MSLLDTSLPLYLWLRMSREGSKRTDTVGRPLCPFFGVSVFGGRGWLTQERGDDEVGRRADSPLHNLSLRYG